MAFVNHKFIGNYITNIVSSHLQILHYEKLAAKLDMPIKSRKSVQLNMHAAQNWRI